MNKHLIIILLLVNHVVEAQNIVSNGNLEEYYSCPTANGQLDKVLDWHSIWMTGGGSSEYFNSCNTIYNGIPKNLFGFQYSKSGKGYIGYGFYDLASNYIVEFSANTLNTQLDSDVTYNIQLYLSKTEASKYAISEIGVHISDTINAYKIWTGNIIPEVINQKGFVYDTLNWVKIEEKYKAKGGEKYIVIGCFNPNPKDTLLAGTGGAYTYYYIEDVAIYPIDTPIASAQCISDTTLCLRDFISPCQTTVEDQYKAEYEWFWYEPGKEKDTLSTEEFPVFQPDSTTTYVLKLTDFKYDVTYNTVKVTIVDCKTPTSLTVYPNPTNDKVYFEFNSTIPEDMYIEIYNLMGQKIIGNLYRSNRETKTIEINLQTQATGIYFYRVLIENEVKFSGKIVKYD